MPGLYGDHAFYYQGDFYFRDMTNAYLRLVEGTQHWRLFVYETEVTDFVGMVQRDGQLYFNLLELAPLLGLTTRLEGGWKISTSHGEVTLWPSSTVLGWQELSIPLVSPVVEEAGVPFVPVDVLPLLGWTVRIDSLRQQVIFLENWGWWV